MLGCTSTPDVHPNIFHAKTKGSATLVGAEPLVCRKFNYAHKTAINGKLL